MFNRYHGRNPALRNAQDLHGRSDIFQILDDHIKNRRSVVIMGVEGVGKSSLLNCYFNYEYRKKLARDQRILIRVTDFPTDRDADGVYQYLAEGVLYAVDTLDQEDTSTLYNEIKKKCLQKMKDSTDSASIFQQICEIIQEFDYNITLVIDGFERFVSSPHVKMEHHDLMNTLIAKNLSFVVATNYDFNQDSLPRTVSGSFLLMKFSGNEVRLKGLPENMISNLAYPEDFTEDEIHQLWILSGGIPSIFRKAAEHAYSQKENGSIVWRDVFDKTYADVSPLIARWCKLFSPDQIQVLKKLIENDSSVGLSFDEDALKTAAQALVNRGLLANPIESGTLRAIPGLYKFNTPLLKHYCKENELQAETISVVNQNAAEKKESQLVKEYEEWLRKSKISLSDTISESLLGQYQLTPESFASYGESVQKFIRTGIVADQNLLDVELFDHSPQFIDFAKALEEHLNLTLLPVFRIIDPAYVLRRGADRSRDSLLGDARHLTIGQFVTILRSENRVVKFTVKAGDFCSSNKISSFPTSWWESLKRDMSDTTSIANIRNDITHVVFVTPEQGKELLRKMFFGEKSIFNRCQSIHNAAKNADLIY